MNDQELQAQQRDVQRSLGRCLLRLQQYERLMKVIVAHHDLSGSVHALEKIRAARRDDASTKTFGTLVGQLFGSYVVTGETDTAADSTANESEKFLSSPCGRFGGYAGAGSMAGKSNWRPVRCFSSARESIRYQ
ncbi:MULTISPECIES: hypothetical protein [unclassified Thiocapsa]|uniref:hypothetical protein n=1 Tax=unclassified Thiocapsa TaxID=2641286 RepID=UPI0035B17BCD